MSLADGIKIANKIYIQLSQGQRLIKFIITVALSVFPGNRRKNRYIHSTVDFERRKALF